MAIIIPSGQFIYPITLTDAPMFGTSWVITNITNINQIIIAPNPPIAPNQILPALCAITGKYNETLKQVTFTAPNCINGSGTPVILSNCKLEHIQIFYNNKYNVTWVITCPFSQQSSNELSHLITKAKTQDFQVTTLQPTTPINNQQNSFWFWIIILIIIILIFVMYYKNNKNKL